MSGSILIVHAGLRTARYAPNSKPAKATKKLQEDGNESDDDGSETKTKRELGTTMPNITKILTTVVKRIQRMRVVIIVKDEKLKDSPKIESLLHARSSI